jgi:PAS domain S-box-containing protein
MAANRKTFVVDDPDLTGGKRYVSFSPVGDIGWTVFVGRDKRAILLSGLEYYIQVTAIALLLFLSIILFLAFSRKQMLNQQTREQLEAERRIRAGHERLKSYVDVTMQLAWTTNDRGEIVEDNPSWSKFTGRGYEAIKGVGWLEDIHPDDRDRTEKVWRKAVAEKALYETEYRLRRYDGVYRDYLARGVPLLADDGSVREWVGACIDISARKKAEKQIQQLNEELEQRVIERTAQLSAANKELEAFSYSVSHDLRAPLRSIDGFSQALLEDYQEKLDDMGKDYLERVRKATQRMGLLIDDMLKLSRITQAEMKHETLDLSAMIRDIVETHQQKEPDRAVDATIQEGMMVQGDPYLMRIAIENLVTNAFKFTGKTADPRIAFGEVRNDTETAYFVRDNGAGFYMAYVGKLFGAFQRLHASDEFPGTGVGLATVQRIIHRHGGRVWAEGEPGKGATFYFALP